VTTFVRSREFTPDTLLALRQLVNDIGNETGLFGELAKIPNERPRNFRNDMYLVSEALRIMQKSHKPEISTAGWAVLANYKKHIDNANKFIPGWVKVAVAMALGLGTMIGWKRIAVTAGERIGGHLTYGQGAAAEITAMFTIGAAGWFGLPVRTTHELSSGICWYDGCKSHWPRVGYGAEPAPGVGIDSHGLDVASGYALLGIPQHLLNPRPQGAKLGLVKLHP
jgi:PiT family inorganic phosphate transporter